MAYALLIVEGVGDRASRSEVDGRQLYDRMTRFADELSQRGLLTLGQSLAGEAAGVRVSGQGPTQAVRDGPFAEAREMVGGFFLLTCATRAEAIEIARRCPAVEWATVEVRELGPCFQ